MNSEAVGLPEKRGCGGYEWANIRKFVKGACPLRMAIRIFNMMNKKIIIEVVTMNQ